MIMFFFGSFVSIKRRRGNATREVDWWRPCCLLNIAVIYPIFSLKKILLYYNFCQKWLDTLHYLLPIQIAFFSRLSLPSQNPKQQTVE